LVVGRREKKEGESGPSQRVEERMGRWCQAGAKKDRTGCPPEGGNPGAAAAAAAAAAAVEGGGDGWRCRVARWLTVGTRWRWLSVELGGREKAKSKICYRKNRALHATAADLSTRYAPRFFSPSTSPNHESRSLPTSPPTPPPLPGASSERRVRCVGVSLTRVRVCCAAWRRTVRNMCTIKYTQKCLLSLALSCLRPPFLGVARTRIRGEYRHSRVYMCVRTLTGIQVRRSGVLST